MVTKILLTMGIVAGVLFALRFLGRSRVGRKSRVTSAEDLIPCPKCGAYRSTLRICDCAEE